MYIHKIVNKNTVRIKIPTKSGLFGYTEVETIAVKPCWTWGKLDPTILITWEWDEWKWRQRQEPHICQLWIPTVRCTHRELRTHTHVAGALMLDVCSLDMEAVLRIPEPTELWSVQSTSFCLGWWPFTFLLFEFPRPPSTDRLFPRGFPCFFFPCV